MLKAGRNPLLISALLMVLFFGNSLWVHAKAGLAQLLIERAWAETLDKGKTTPPWSWADFWPVARIVVKKTGKELFVLSSASGQSLAFGPGHVNGSPLPVTAGMSIIAAHRDTHFNFLESIKTGDVFRLQRADGLSRNYRVIDLQVVDIRFSRLNIEAGQDGLKFVTCYPFDAVLPGGSKRLVVELIAETVFQAG